MAGGHESPGHGEHGAEHKHKSWLEGVYSSMVKGSVQVLGIISIATVLSAIGISPVGLLAGGVMAWTLTSMLARDKKSGGGHAAHGHH